MIGDFFVKWMRHFVAFVNASVTNKVLLILDGHSSHKNLEALEFAKANGVILLCLPPHSTHRMQPTDVSFFGPLKIGILNIFKQIRLARRVQATS